MKIKVADLSVVLRDYLAADVLPKATANPILQFMLGITSIKLTDHTVANFLSAYMPVLQALDIIDKDGEIDIDDLYETATKALSDYCSGAVEVMGYRADQDDLDSLRNIAMKHGH